MKRFAANLLFILIAASMILSQAAPAAGTGDVVPQFPDIEGHWAQQALLRAVGDGLLGGFEDGHLRPDAHISTAQMLAVICRLLGAQAELPASSIGLRGDEWYASYARRAAAMSIIDTAEGIAGPASRQDAGDIIARAFKFVEAEPDMTVLSPFWDANRLSGQAQSAMAILVGAGIIQGVGNGLNIDGFITRAEFIAIIYRIVDGVAPASGVSGANGGRILTGTGTLRRASFATGAWFDCSTSSVTMSAVTAPMIVLRSQESGPVIINGASNITRLVLGTSGDGGREITVSNDSHVDSVIIGETNEHITIGTGVRRAEITGDGSDVAIIGDLEELVVSGRGNRITINSQSLGSLRVLEGGSGNIITISGSVETAYIGGDSSELTVNGYVGNLAVSGRHTRALGSGAIGDVDQLTAYFEISAQYDTLTDSADYGIPEAELLLSAPTTLPPGQTLNVTAVISSPFDAEGCFAIWSLDGEIVKEDLVTVTGGGLTIEFSQEYEYSRVMPESSEIGFTLRYITRDGDIHEYSSIVRVELENYPRSHYDRIDEDRVLSLVTTAYLGDFTLEWALDNDYEDYEKEVWINAKGHSSTTDYLIWINLAYQRVNVFKGSAGDWELIHTFLSGSGALSTPTPVGVYTVWGRSAAGWTTSTYNVRPVVNFRVGSGYAFHSRLYDPRHTYLTDDSIGFPVSLGCIRMYDEDVRWIFDNIPNGTTVVVF